MKLSPSFPVILETAPPGARLPLRILYIRVRKRDYRRKMSRYPPNMTCVFDGFFKRTNNILVEGELAVLMCPPVKILSESETSDRQIVAIYKVMFHQVC